jgi:hypothetical protein
LKLHADVSIWDLGTSGGRTESPPGRRSGKERAITMQDRIDSKWQKALWKLLTQPTFEVVAAIVVMLLATWIVVSTEVELKQPGSAGFVVVPR